MTPRAPRWPSAADGLVAGVDEVGRGPLAGPVVAAAVILDPSRPIAGLADSKRLGAAARERLAAEIAARATAVGIGAASAAEIDALNILQATFVAMRRAVAALATAPTALRIDGNVVPPGLPALPAVAIVRGDASDASIAAASIVAKVHRDRLCDALHAAHPGYGFDRHRGYPSAGHRRALAALGPCPEHRRSFRPVADAIAAARAAQADPAARTAQGERGDG